MEFNLERPLVHPPVSKTTPAEVIDLTCSSTAPGQLNLDRPHHKASSSGLTLTTPPTSINLEHPLRKAKSAQSYSGLPPSDKKPLFAPGRETHPSAKQELTEEDWADEKLSFPRSKVGDALYHIFRD